MSRLRMFMSMSLLGLVLVAVIGCGGKKDGGEESESSGSSSNSSSASGNNSPSGGSSAFSGNVQESSLPKEKRAVIAFDLDLGRVMNSEIGSMLPTEQALGELGAAGPEADALMSVKRIAGFVSAPEDLGSVMGMAMMGPSPGQPLPVEFVISVEFVDAAAASEPMAEIKQNSTKTTIGGKEVYKPQDPNGPPLFIRIVSDTKIEAGTEMYLTSGSAVGTRTLQERWKGMPDVAMKLALDMDGARELLDGASAMLRQDAPPMAAPYIDLLDKGAFMSLAIDASGDQLVHMTMDGHNAEETQAINTVVAGLLQLANFGAAGSINDMRSQSPKMADMMSNLLKSLGTTVSGNTVSVTVAKPEGFEDALKEGMAAAQVAAQQVAALNDMKQLALAIHNYHDAMRRFPFAADPTYVSEELSWRVLILPYVEENALYDRFDTKQGWDGETNKLLAEEMPAVFGGDSANSTVVYIRPDKPVQTFGGVLDGSSMSIMLLETLNPVPWTKNQDISVKEAIEMVNSLPEGQQVRAARYDGSAIMLPGDYSPEEIEAMMDPTDGR